MKPSITIQHLVKVLLPVVILFLAAANQKVLSQNAPLSTVGTVVTTGLTATVPITAINFNNIASCNLQLLFDPDVAVVTDVTLASGLGGMILSNLNTPGVFRISWFSYSSGYTLPDNSVIFNIHLSKVSGGTTDIEWDPNYLNRNWGDGDGLLLNDNPMGDYYFPGSLTFQSDAPITIAPEITACPNSFIDIPVTVLQFNTIGALSLKLLFDNDVLEYLSFTNDSGFPGLLVENPNLGVITISGLSATQGITLPDEATLFTLHFNYFDGETGLEWFDDGTSCEYTGPPPPPNPGYNPLNDMPASTFYINGSVSPCAQATIYLFFEGLYNTTTNQMNKTHDFDGNNIIPKFVGTIADLITVELRDPNNYSAVILQVNNIPLHQDGSAGFSIEEPLTGSYYIRIKTRNHLETVSAMPVSFNDMNITYDFRNAASQAYGNNMKELSSGVWGLYAGDINGDGIINLSDRQLINDQYLSTTRGYFPTDINGDGIINLSDRQIVNDAYLQTITAKTP